MEHRPSPPIHVTLNGPNWHFQIHHGNQPLNMSHILQNQRPQINQNFQTQQPSTNTSGVVLNIPSSAEDNHEEEENQQAAPRQHNTSLYDDGQSFINTFNQALQQNPELRKFFKIAATFLPFLVIVLIKEIFKHTTEIVVVLALITTFIYANKTLAREVSKQAKRELRPLLVITVNILACFWLIDHICGEKELYHTFLVFPEENAPFTFTKLFWTVIATDHVLKLLTVLAKTIIAACPMRLFPLCHRGKCYVFTERSSQLYRNIASIPPWIHYLFSSQLSPESSLYLYSYLINIGLCAVYFTCKVFKLTRLLKKWKHACTKLFHTTIYGDPPSKEQIEAAGPMCPICHDSYKKPTLLSCKHIFCEECLAVWLDRERTCPMCRSTVAENPKWKDGSTTYLIQFY